MKRTLVCSLFAASLALLPGIAFGQGIEAPPLKESAPMRVEPRPGPLEGPVYPPRPRTTMPSSGGSGGVSDFFGSNQAGGTSSTPESGGAESSGEPNTQSSGQSGSPFYPY